MEVIKINLIRQVLCMSADFRLHCAMLFCIPKFPIILEGKFPASIAQQKSSTENLA